MLHFSCLYRLDVWVNDARDPDYVYADITGTIHVKRAMLWPPAP